jgi:Na+/H+-dicarboxylate symporter/ABC-type amino acid transport substrate-binding protein
MSFTLKIVLGLVLGVFTGLFLGEIAAPFVVVGEIFIGLLQMTVLPYIVISLIANLGRISWSESRGLLLSAMAVLAALLVLGVFALLTVPLAFPDWKSATFFSSSLVEQPKVFDLVALYIPANPFNALANNIVPASVLFSILLGIGVSGIRGNEGLLQALDVLADALNRINKLVIKLTPVGAFAIAAGVAGTTMLAEISKLQAYLLSYTVVGVILTFVVLPLIITAVTPFRYRDLVTIPRQTLVTIFATGKIIVVLPQLIEDIQELFRRYKLNNDETAAGTRILLPLAYPFPNLGTYTILMFIPFCAWYLGRSFDLVDHLTFHSSALLSSFVAPIIGIPFMLDLLQIPADMMELFVMSTVYTDRIRVVLGAMHLITLTVIAVSISQGVFRINWRRLLRAGLVSMGAVVVSLLLLRAYLGAALTDSYSGDRNLIEITWMDRPVPARVFHGELPEPEAAVAERGRLAIIEERGSLRVGYLSDSLPFAFRNDQGEVVGYDVEMGHHMASDLGVELEQVLVDKESFNTLFESGQIDIVMSGITMTPGRIRKWNFGDASMDVTLGFLVPDYRRNEFRSHEAVLRIADLRLGIVQFDKAFQRQTEQRFPNAQFEDLASPRSFLRGREPQLDALVYSAEGGSAWTLIYPGYTMVVPHPVLSKVPLGYPLPQGDPEWSRYVNEWSRLKKKNGTTDALFDHWIRGGGAQRSGPRWSILRDVLHWIE